MKSLTHSFVFILLTTISVFGQWVNLTSTEPKPVSVSLLEESPSGTVIECKTPGYFLNAIDIQGKILSVVSIPEAVTFLVKGFPDLPQVSKSVMISDEAKMKFEILEAEFETTYVATIIPSKGSLPRSIDPDKVPYTFADVYKKDNFWPQQVVELSEPFIIRDIRGITVQFNPFRHNAVKGQLIVCKRIVIRVFTDGIDNVNLKTTRKGIITLDMTGTYERVFLNFSQRIGGVLGKVSYNAIQETGRMLIIAADDFYNSAIPLRDWRTRKGFKTTLVKCSDVGTTSSAIKTYIQDMYNGAGSVLYILLVGDGTNIPSKGVPYPGGYANPKDPTYVLLAGTDAYPDAYISRISAESVTQVENQITRILKYETCPAPESWFQKACGIASHEGNPADTTRCNLLRDNLLTYGYTSVDKLYDITTASPISDVLDDGRGIVNFIGHGVPTSWGFNYPNVWPLFSVTDVQNLTNTNLLPFVFSVACEVGSFAETSTCFAEAWLRSGTKDNPKGAIGFYGSSIGQPWNEPIIAQAEAVNLLVADTKVTIGGLCFNGSCKMIQDYPSTGPEVFNTWHIFGDAATHVWTKTPMNFTSTSVTDNGSSITVNAGIAGSTICVSSGNNGSSFWQCQDNISNYTFNTSVRPLYITVTKHNYIPYTAVTGGTFSSNEYWFGNQKVLGNATFSTGSTLNIMDIASVITFNSGKKLSVYGGGSLIANGATFQGNGNPGYWNSIYFYANSSGSIQNCTIRDAQAGIYTTTNANVTVSGCTITNNSLYGLSIIQNSNVTVSNCTISSNGTGINTNSSITPITGNYILNNTNYGINANNISNSLYWYNNTLQGNGYAMLLNNASPYIHNNFISDNAHGVVITSSSPNFANPSNQWRGYNAITCNSAIPNFKAQNYSTVYMGYGYDGGYNSIFGSDLPDMESINHSGIYADNNYWGSQSPQVYADGTSWILSRTPLGSDPNPGSGCSGSMASSLGKNSYSPSDEGDAAVKYWEAISQGRSGNLQKAKELFQLIIDGKFHQKYSPLALLSFYEFSSNDKVGLKNILSGINSRAKDDLLRPFAVRLLAREAALSNNKDMVFYNTELVKNYPNSVNELTALYDLIIYYSETEQDLAIANSYFSRLKEVYPDEDLTLFAGINLGINLGDLKKETSTEKVPETFYLSDAFPNPFNPTTQIKFSVPKDEFVTLRVYDILGKEVAQLVNEQKFAGTYSVGFDASKLASGIYFYAISAGKFNQVKKMVLLR